MKKLLSFILAFVLIISVVPITASAETTTSGTTGDCTWTLDGTVLTISGNGKMGNYLNYCGPWGTSITKVSIEKGVTSIGNSSFRGCKNLTSITIPNSITIIDDYAFYHCTTLKSLTIPDSVTSIGDGAFSNCFGLTSITLPDSVTKMGRSVFEGCRFLTEINVDTNNVNFYSKDGVLFNKNITCLISYPAGKTETTYIVPDNITSIEDSAFYGCNSLTTVKLPNSVERIGSFAFYECNSLTFITMPDSMLHMGWYVFYYCGSLTQIAIPNGVESIGDRVFGDCVSLLSVTIPASVTSIDDMAFSGCSSLENISVAEDNTEYCSIDDVLFDKNITKLIHYPSSKKDTSYKIPDSVTSISSYAFEGCSYLTMINIPESVMSIGSCTFENCVLLKSVILPNGMTNIPGSAFQGCISLKNIFIPDSITNIGLYAFWGCNSLVSVVIPDGIKSLNDGLFYDCNSLIEVTIPASVTSIGHTVFERCYNLEKVYFSGDVNDWCSINFENYYSNPLCYAGELYLNGELLSGEVILSDSVTIIPTGTFKNQPITNVIIPVDTTEIGIESFYGCKKIRQIEFPSNLSIIEASAFAYSGLKVVYLPKSITKIDSDAFYETELNYVYYEGTQADREMLNILSGNDTLENAVWIYEQSGMPNHEYDSDCDNVCNICEEIRTAPNHINSDTCDNADCEYTRIITVEELQAIMDAIPETMELDIPGDKYIKSPGIVASKIKEILKEQGFKYEERNSQNIVLKVLTITGYGIEIEFYFDYLARDSVDMHNIHVKTCRYKNSESYVSDEDTYRISKTIKLKYNNSDKYKREDAEYIKNLVLVSPAYYEIDIDDLINTSSYSWDEFHSAIEEYYNKQINDASINVISETYAGTGGLNFSTHGGVHLKVYKNGFLYDVKHFGDSYGIPVIMVPYEIADEKVYDYVVDKISQYNGLEITVTGMDPSETIYGYEADNVYHVFYNDNYGSDDGYIILKKETKCSKCVYDTDCDAICNRCKTIRSITHKYNSGKVTKAATCKVTGVKTYTCSVCKGTKTEIIAKSISHTYSNNCDKSCNVCKKNRTVGAHRYSNSCDITCNCCNAKRTIKHTYTNSCDTKCNVCSATRTISHAYKTTTTKATLTKNGSIVKKCTVCGNMGSNVAINKISNVELSSTIYAYNGKTNKPTVTIKDSTGKKLKKGTDYTVSYAKGCKKVGSYKVTVAFKGHYSGKKVLTFKINPTKTDIKKLTAANKSLKVKITKKTKEVTGYEIQYSTSKKFKSAKKITIKKVKTSSAIIKKLKTKKTYYVRVRTYKVVKGKKYYSAWSKVKYKKTK